MSIRCGHCGGIHDSVADVRQCSSENVGNKTDAEIEVEAIVREDPWEGATESEPGVWSPGPAAYLEARRYPPAAAAAEYGHEIQGGFGGPTADEIRKKQWDEMLKDLDEGFYALSEDEIYRVVRSKTGRLYAKLYVGTQSGGHWEYAAGAITKLKPGMRMDLDDIKKHGKETGTCLVCGRELTNPDSIEAGIGPVCASRL